MSIIPKATKNTIFFKNKIYESCMLIFMALIIFYICVCICLYTYIYIYHNIVDRVTPSDADYGSIRVPLICAPPLLVVALMRALPRLGGSGAWRWSRWVALLCMWTKRINKINKKNYIYTHKYILWYTYVYIHMQFYE